MKKLMLSVASLVILLGMLTSCLSQGKQEELTTNTKDAREVVWNQLTSKDIDLMGNWQDGKIDKMVLYEDESAIVITDKSYIRKEVYRVDFPRGGISKPNGMTVYASIDDYKIIGYTIAE